MKKWSFLILILAATGFSSCGDSDQPTPVVDDYKLLSVTTSGKILEIGNNTGATVNIGQITNQSNLIQLATICNVGSKIYCLEASYVPSPNILTVYDKATKTTTTQQLILPPSIAATMTDPFITNLEYNGSEFIAVVSENMPNNMRPNKIISINPVNYQTTDLNIDFFQRTLTSTELINDKLYIATRTEGLLKIDLTQKTVTELQANGARINATRLAKNGTTKLSLMKLGVPQVINGVQPYEYDLSNNTLTDKSQGAIFAVGNITGGTLVKNGEYINYVFNATNGFGILKVNTVTNEQKFVALDQNAVGSNCIIIDTLP
ncbi:hypothetical protein [Flavobacterium sp.]|uniref:hypothetical protein n=1 Tax=Flavobacterium sp. TaxID=239 RepID=UPI002605DB78|nr:hypothetical protein [Flavobacterium sp.]